MDSVEAFRQAVAAAARPTGCGVGLVLDSLDPDLRAAVNEALGNRSVSHSRIAAALREVGASLPDGRPLAQQTIGRHRRGDCGCGR